MFDLNNSIINANTVWYWLALALIGIDIDDIVQYRH